MDRNIRMNKYWIAPKKRNTYGVDTFFPEHGLRFFAPEFMADCAEKT